MSRNLGIKASNKGDFYFVSYNSEDEARVSEYVQLLSEHGVTLWYDDGIRKSKKWEEELADNLEKCKAVIMFVSKSIFAKQESYVRTEFNIAKNNFGKEIYIIHLDEVKPSDIPNRYTFWWASISDLQSFEAFRHKSVSSCVYEILDSLGIDGVEDEESSYTKDFKHFVEKVSASEGFLACPDGTVYTESEGECLYVSGDVSHAMWLLTPQYMKKLSLVFSDIPRWVSSSALPKSELFRIIVLSRQLLTEDGLIILKTDIQRFVDCKSFCDEIIGEQNLVGVITVERKSRSVNCIGLNNDFLLIYSPNTCVFKRIEDYIAECPDAEGVKSNWNDPKYSSTKSLIKDILNIFLPRNGILTELYTTSDVHARVTDELNKKDGGERRYILIGGGLDAERSQELGCKYLKIHNYKYQQ